MNQVPTEQFREILKESSKQISVSMLAYKSGIHPNTIWNYLRGTNPTLDKADKLLKALGKTIVLGEH